MKTLAPSKRIINFKGEKSIALSETCFHAFPEEKFLWMFELVKHCQSINPIEENKIEKWHFSTQRLKNGQDQLVVNWFYNGILLDTLIIKQFDLLKENVDIVYKDGIFFLDNELQY